MINIKFQESMEESGFCRIFFNESKGKLHFEESCDTPNKIVKIHVYDSGENITTMYFTRKQALSLINTIFISLDRLKCSNNELMFRKTDREFGKLSK